MRALFESYNARFLDLKTVGSTFVIRDKDFKRICAEGNTLILGPRGSGKTTLLKMMKIGAQLNSQNRINYRTLKDIKYKPVYLAADRQFDLLTTGIYPSRDPDSEALYWIPTLLTAIRTKFALLDTLAEISNENVKLLPTTSHHYVYVDRAQESEFCRLLSRAWRIEFPALSFREIRASLSAEIERVNDCVRLYFDGSDKYYQLKDQIVHSEPVSAAISFIDTFGSVFPKQHNSWCLCVDELEIMPKELQKYFFGFLRSSDHRLRFKIATSPFTAAFSIFDTTSSPMDSNDYQAVNLSAGRKKDGVKFTRRLVGDLIKNSSLPKHTTISMILGRSPIAESGIGGDHIGGGYSSPNGVHYKRFKALKKSDSFFADYLERNNIDVEHLDDLVEGVKAAKVRQAIWQVALRSEFGEIQDFSKSKNIYSKRKLSKKAISSLYTGSDSILTVCEGNPRVTIGVFRDLIRMYESTGHKRVTVREQARILEFTIARFISLLYAIPLETGVSKKPVQSIVSLIEKIGAVCESDNLVGEFKPESLSTFIVNDDLDDSLIEPLGAAINQGAFIMIENAEKQLNYGKLRGARIRLSYLLCPRYKLPLTYGRKIQLKRIINETKNSNNPNMTIGDLFDGQEG